ncbi:MAG: hypothetical protein V1725_00415 [archaeon]
MIDLSLPEKNVLRTQLAAYRVSLTTYERLKQAAEYKAKKDPSSTFANRDCGEENIAVWCMRDRPGLECDYNVLLIKNSFRALGIFPEDRPIAEVEEGILLHYHNPERNLVEVIERIFQDELWFSVLKEKYAVRKHNAHHALIAARRDHLPLHAVLMDVLPFSSLLLDMVIPKPEDAFLENVAPTYYASRSPAEKAESVCALFTQLSGRNYYVRIEQAVLNVVRKNLLRKRDASTFDICQLINSVGYLAREGLLPCPLETEEGMRALYERLCHGLSAPEEVDNALDDIFFRQRLNRIHCWKEQQKIIVHVPIARKRFVRDTLDFITLAMEYNEENRDVRNQLFEIMAIRSLEKKGAYTARLEELA